MGLSLSGDEEEFHAEAQRTRRKRKNFEH